MRVKLGDICEIVGGSTPKSNVPEYWDGDVKWITPAELNEDSYILYDSVRRITELGVQKTGLPSFPAGTVILSSRAPIGKVAIAGCVMYCNQGFKNLICSDAINNKYLYWFLKGKTDYLNSLGRGATFKEISKQIVANIEIELPPIERQKEIVDQFEMIAAVLRHRHEQLSALDDLIKARFVEMFGDPEYNDKGWPVKKMNDLCNIGSSKRIYQEEQTMDGIPFWRISDLVAKMDTGNVESNLYIPESKYEELKGQGLVPKTGDILVTSRGTLGRCYIISPEDRFYFQDGMISWLSHYADEITPFYIQYLFDMPGFKKQIDSMQAGSTVAYLSIAMLKKLDIMLPGRELQNQFAAFVAQIDKSKSVIQKSLDETKLLFDSLMQEYFSGDIS